MEKESGIIKELAKRGEQHDVMDALRLLANAYMDMCGISLGCRSVVFYAAEKWQEKLVWTNLPLSEIARKMGLINFLSHITSEFDSEIYNRYDIAAMDDEELLACCQQIVDRNDFDESTIEVLCWGIMNATKKEEISQEIEAVAQDGTTLKGELTAQHCGFTSLHMTTPYNTQAFKMELVRDPKELLIQAYNDIQRLKRMEIEVRALYPKYQEKLKKCKNSREKNRVFYNTYDTIIDHAVIPSSSLSEMFNDWWGLEFYFPKYE